VDKRTHRLAALALEEIGMSSMVFMSAISPRPIDEGETTISATGR
jgi:hypothetical protein